MAVIGKLRKRAGLVIIIIAFALLAFILPEVVNSFKSGGGQDNVVGVIMGDDVEYGEYAKVLQEKEQEYKLNINKYI